MTPYACIASLLIFVALSLGFDGSRPDPQQQTAPKFDELSRDDAARLDRQRALVAEAMKQRYGAPALTRNKADLSVLQRLIDDHAFSKTQT